MWGTLHKDISGHRKFRMTDELMHSKRHAWSPHSRAIQTAEIHEVALMFKKIIHITCINLVGITCENRRTTTDFRIYDLHHRSGEYKLFYTRLVK